MYCKDCSLLWTAGKDSWAEALKHLSQVTIWRIATVSLFWPA